MAFSMVTVRWLVQSFSIANGSRPSFAALR